MSQDPQHSPEHGEYPYGDQSTPGQPSSEQAANPYGASDYPYGDAENPYAIPQYPYKQPSNENPPSSATPSYAEQPPSASTDSYNNLVPPLYTPGPGYDYGYPPPETTPLPLDQAIRQLPGQYKRVLTKPSATTFQQEKDKASWDIIWVQMLAYAAIAAILALLASVLGSSSQNLKNLPVPPYVYQRIILGISVGYIFLIPLGFFISVGIYHLVAKAFKGSGSYKQYLYSYLLFAIPLGLLGGLCNLIPILGPIVGFGIWVYQTVLAVFATMAVHRLSGGKASLVILLPLIVAFMLICAATILAIAVASRVH